MHQDFLDLLRAFIDGNVRFLIVGAYALAVHGRPRATGDLDVWVDATPENAARVMSALEQLAPRRRRCVPKISAGPASSSRWAYRRCGLTC